MYELYVPVILGSYLIGCFNTGYYIIRLRTGKDIRTLGSGNAGATNVNRVIGKSWAVIAFLADAGKGAVAVWAARQFSLELWAVMLAMAAVVAGHVFPIQLGFKGGKGAATALGAVTVLDWRITVVLVLVTGVCFLFFRRLTPSGLIAIILTPIVAITIGEPEVVSLGVGFLTLLVLFAHRKDILSLVRHRVHRERTGL